MTRTPVLTILTIALVLSLSAACSKTDETSSTSGTTSGPGTSGGSGATATTSGGTASGTSGSTPGSTPGSAVTTDQAIDALPIGDTQKSCLKDRVNSDPGLKAILDSKKVPTKTEATAFINVALSCMSRAELTTVLTSDQPNPDSPQAKCETSKIAQMTEDQLAGFIGQDPATLAEVKGGFDLCSTVGTTAAP